jgi:hypothetical protein
MNENSRGKIAGWACGALIMIALAALGMAGTRATEPAQDLSIRLSNIERRVDQLQQRIDFVERGQQNQAMSSINRSSSSASPEMVLEMQRQQLVVADQVTLLQRQLLELRKQVDQLSGANPDPKKSEPPKEERKPRPPSRQP